MLENPAEDSAQLFVEYKKVFALKNEIEQLNAKLKESKNSLIRNFIPYVKRVYDAWRPKIGEVVICIHLIDRFAYANVVSEVSGHMVRVLHIKNHSMTVDLDIKKSEYELDQFVLPLHAYNDIKEGLNLPDYAPLRYPKDELLAQKHFLPLR